MHFELSVQFYIGLIKTYDDELKPIIYDSSFVEYFHPTVALVDTGTSTQRNQMFRFLWTPDNKKIVYAVRQPGEPDGTIYMAGNDFVAVATGVIEPVANNVDLAPDGRRVVYVSGNGIMVAPVDGNYEPRQLLDGKASYPRWSPDGRHVAYVDDTGISIVAADGVGRRPVPDTVDAVSIAWAPQS